MNKPYSDVMLSQWLKKALLEKDMVKIENHLKYLTHEHDKHKRNYNKKLRELREIKRKNEVFIVRHGGHYMPGISLVVSDTDENIEELLRPKLEKEGLAYGEIKSVKHLKLNKQGAYVLENGDY